MNSKKILLYALASLVALSSVLCTSCVKGDKKENTGSGQRELDALENKDGKTGLFIPEGLSGKGESFDIFLAYGSFDGDYIVEEETGETIKDIIYHRNKEVEDKFDIKLNFSSGGKWKTNSEATPQIRSYIQSGDDTFEVYMNVQHAGIPLIYEDLFVEWNENMPYANLDNPWWYQNVKRDLNFGDKVYVMVGDYNFHALSNSACLAFNKTIMDELNMEYPYEMVKDGSWTINNFIEMVKAGQKDLNGDGVMKPADDRYGFSGWSWEMMPAVFVGMGGKPVLKDDSNLPTLNIANERTFTILDRMLELFDDGNGGWDGGNDYSSTQTMFTSSRLLFQNSTLSSLTALRNLDDDFGAVPFPKLDEDQEEYYARIVNYSSLTYVPVTNKKLDLTSAVLEYMAYISHNELIPAFYDEILTIKTSRDTETEEMIDIVRDGATFMDENYLSSSIIRRMILNGENTLASEYASQGEAWNTKLDEIIEFWEK